MIFSIALFIYVGVIILEDMPNQMCEKALGLEKGIIIGKNLTCFNGTKNVTLQNYSVDAIA